MKALLEMHERLKTLEETLEEMKGQPDTKDVILLGSAKMLLSREAAEYIRPDLCTVGGLTGAKKIAALAEARYVGVVPHNPLSSVSTSACLQLAACIPNFVIQEFPRYETMPVKELVKASFELKDGYVSIPDTPGIGAELNEDVLDKYPSKPRTPWTLTRKDGSIVDCRIKR